MQPPPAARRLWGMSLSVCYMIKNEEEFIGASLTSVLELPCEEILIFDTGSKDKSPSILKSFQAKDERIDIHKLEWTNHFSDARNKIAKKARGEWIFFVDGDEVLDAETRRGVEQAIQSQKSVAFSLIQRNYTLDASQDQVIPFEGTNLPGLNEFPKSPVFYTDNYMERLYKKTSGLVYEGRIHESLLPFCRRRGLQHEKLPLILHHYGRLKSGHRQKLVYYLDLSRQKLKEEAQNPIAWVEYLVTLSELDEQEAAYKMAQLAIRQFPQEAQVLLTAYQVALRAGAYPEAEQWIRMKLRLTPEDLYSKSNLSTALMFQKKFDQSSRTALEVLGHKVDDFIANFNLGVIAFEEKRWLDAKRYLHAALKLKPQEAFILQALKKIEAEQQTN